MNSEPWLPAALCEGERRAEAFITSRLPLRPLRMPFPTPAAVESGLLLFCNERMSRRIIALGPL